MKKSTLVLIAILVILASVSGGWLVRTIYNMPVSSPKEVSQALFTNTPSVPSDKDMEKEMIRYDIQETGKQIGLSQQQQDDYLSYVEGASNKYKLPMILIHTIAYVESDYDPSVVHPQIKVKGKVTRALGEMGVVWEYNSAALIKEGTAVSRLELTIPKNNIFSGAFLIHQMVDEILVQKPNLQEEKFFDELIRKYYGAYDEAYKTRMQTKIKDIASKQWIRRAIKTILFNFKSAPIVNTSSEHQ